MITQALPLLLSAAAALACKTATSLQDAERFTTDRESPVELRLPEEDDAFTFVVFGDRTGGPAEGIRVLAQAVQDVNVLEPDLVMTVGDLINGYNQPPEWLDQMAEFKQTMDRLECPWYPVAGNHDVYWRGPDRPPNEHEENYETHFGPLWYALRHKDCWFIVLYTDEGNPLTGERNFSKPECQRMSPAQFAFLDRTLTRASGARHVFVFLHHPRWLGGGYGEDWKRVHARLVEAGNVSAVFAGHIHRMVHSGFPDGIEYMTLATVGAHQSGIAPQAGYLHHWNLVTVRDDRVAVSAFPVGAAFDPRSITPEVGQAARALSSGLKPHFPGRTSITTDGVVDGLYRIEFENPIDRPIELSLGLESADSRWIFIPDHHHVQLAPGESVLLASQTLRSRAPLDETFELPLAQLQVDYLTGDHRVSMPLRTLELPLALRGAAPQEVAGMNRALHLDGRRDHVIVRHDDLDLPDGPFTLECWASARSFSERAGLLCKTESAEFGLFVNGGIPEFIVHLSGKYVKAGATTALTMGEWHHLAGVFDGEQVRLYVDGLLVAAMAGSGPRTTRDLPLLVGADVGGDGLSNSHFDGRIDEVHLSRGARYRGEGFQPARRLTPDGQSLLALRLDRLVGGWVYDSSGRERHPRLGGRPTLVVCD